VYVASFQTDPVAVSAIAVFARNKTSGALSQLEGQAGCISEDGTGGACTDAFSVFGSSSVAVSKDGKHVYVASRISHAVAVFARNKSTGALTQLPGTQGCISEGGSGGLCTEGRGLNDVVALATSQDGKHVYVASKAQSTIAVLTRNRTTGALTQTPGFAGCVVEGGSVGPCDIGNGIIAPVALVVSPDGGQVYVASEVSDAVATFSRDDVTGGLTQATPPDGCIGEDDNEGACIDGDALRQPSSVAIGRDGKHVYVGARDSDAVAVFARDRTTGALTQLPSPDGCISSEDTEGLCGEGRALDAPRSVVVSPDGRQVYVASQGSDGVSILQRER
jgi:DNA-binding beta-propeller fold protein YncE